MGIVSHIFSRI